MLELFVRDPFLFTVIIISVVFNYWFKSYSAKKMITMYDKYFQDLSSVGLTGAATARKLLDANNLAHVVVEECAGFLTDHYDSYNKAVRLSTDNFHRPSLVGVTIAAYEVGHAIQDANKNVMLRIRHSVIGFIMISLKFKLYAIFIGLGIVLMLFTGISSRVIASMLIGIVLLFCLDVVLLLVTLAVEKDASNKAIFQMKSLEMIADNEEKTKMKKILVVAILIYVLDSVFRIDLSTE